MPGWLTPSAWYCHRQYLAPAQDELDPAAMRLVLVSSSLVQITETGDPLVLTDRTRAVRGLERLMEKCPAAQAVYVRSVMPSCLGGENLILAQILSSLSMTMKNKICLQDVLKSLGQFCNALKKSLEDFC